MKSLEEQFKAAQNAKSNALAIEAEERKNNINLFVWKGAKGKNKEQVEKRLVDMTEYELNKCYSHCKSMLYNTDKDNPGRYVLLDIIKDQRTRCNAELFLRYLENVYKPSTSRRPMQRYNYMNGITTFLSANAEHFPSDRKLIDITDVSENVPEEFHGIPVSHLIDGCLRRLGVFDKKHMTLTFITTKLGLWFSQSELTEFTEEARKRIATYSPERIAAEKITVASERVNLVKERCGLKPSIDIEVLNNKVLTFKEFRALIQLRSKTYSEMTTDQLEVLRNKGLFCLEEMVMEHARQWEDRISQIKKVAEFKGITLS